MGWGEGHATLGLASAHVSTLHTESISGLSPEVLRAQVWT